MILGGVTVKSISRKKNINTKRSTEAELIGADDKSTMILWIRLFTESQGYNIDNKIL